MNREPLTDGELDALEGSLALATPQLTNGAASPGVLLQLLKDGLAAQRPQSRERANVEADAILFIQAVNAIPALLDEVRASRARAPSVEDGVKIALVEAAISLEAMLLCGQGNLSNELWARIQNGAGCARQALSALSSGGTEARLSCAEAADFSGVEYHSISSAGGKIEPTIENIGRNGRYGDFTPISVSDDVKVSAPPADSGVPADEVTESTIRGIAKKLVVDMGWKRGERPGLHSVIELMTKCGLAARLVNDRCNYPECGCDADATCAVAEPMLSAAPSTPGQGWEDIAEPEHIFRSGWEACERAHLGPSAAGYPDDPDDAWHLFKFDPNAFLDVNVAPPQSHASQTGEV